MQEHTEYSQKCGIHCK